MPKLDPTTPVQVQFSSAAFIHLAVAVAPTFRHAIDAKTGEKASVARTTVDEMVMFAVATGFAGNLWMHLYAKQQTLPLIYSFHS